MKNHAGWTKNLSPTSQSKDGKIINDPKGIADMINIAQISRNIKLHREVTKSMIDHKTNYRKLVIGKNLEFQLRTINMTELKTTIKNMKASNSAGVDGISVKTLKKIIRPLYPAILNLVNNCITTSTYPEALKISKVIPLRKQNKPENEPLSYRAVNILPSIGKIIDKIVNKQLTRHITMNNLILQQHHGVIKCRSTMTAVLSMLDEWAESLENGGRHHNIGTRPKCCIQYNLSQKTVRKIRNTRMRQKHDTFL